jgi:hypothetical protein
MVLSATAGVVWACYNCSEAVRYEPFGNRIKVGYEGVSRSVLEADDKRVGWGGEKEGGVGLL